MRDFLSSLIYTYIIISIIRICFKKTNMNLQKCGNDTGQGEMTRMKFI